MSYGSQEITKLTKMNVSAMQKINKDMSYNADDIIAGNDTIDANSSRYYSLKDKKHNKSKRRKLMLLPVIRGSLAYNQFSSSISLVDLELIS